MEEFFFQEKLAYSPPIWNVWSHLGGGHFFAVWFCVFQFCQRFFHFFCFWYIFFLPKRIWKDIFASVRKLFLLAIEICNCWSHKLTKKLEQNFWSQGKSGQNEKYFTVKNSPTEVQNLREKTQENAEYSLYLYIKVFSCGNLRRRLWGVAKGHSSWKFKTPLKRNRLSLWMRSCTSQKPKDCCTTRKTKKRRRETVGEMS